MHHQLDPFLLEGGTKNAHSRHRMSVGVSLGRLDRHIRSIAPARYLLVASQVRPKLSRVSLLDRSNNLQMDAQSRCRIHLKQWGASMEHWRVSPLMRMLSLWTCSSQKDLEFALALQIHLITMAFSSVALSSVWHY